MIDVPNSQLTSIHLSSRKIKLYKKFYVYLPIILIIFMIFTIYITYFYKYLYLLLYRIHKVNNIYALPILSYEDYYRKKGIILLIITGVSFLLLIVSLFRTIFMDPGYFKDPSKFENHIIMKNGLYRYGINKSKFEKMEKSESEREKEDRYRRKKNRFLMSFEKCLNRAPTTFYEFFKFFNKLSNYTERHEELNNEKKEKRFDFSLSKATKKLLGVRLDLIRQHESSNQNSMTNEKEKPNINEEISIYEDLESLEFAFNHFQNIDVTRSILCNSCLRWKFERSHHCRICRKCVLKMDHHCPWVSNCIGLRNYKYFFLTNYYGTILSFFISISFWETIFNFHTFDESSIILYSYLIIVYIGNFSLMLFVFVLLISNLKLILNGMTVIEFNDKERFPSTKLNNIYDLGYYRNLKTVFGDNPLIWLLPFWANYKGLGIVYETNERENLSNEN